MDHHSFLLGRLSAPLTLVGTIAFGMAVSGCTSSGDDGGACVLGLNGYECNSGLACDLNDKTCKPTGSVGKGGDCSGNIVLCASGLYCATVPYVDAGIEATGTCQPQFAHGAACVVTPLSSCATGFCEGPAGSMTGTCSDNLPVDGGDSLGAPGSDAATDAGGSSD